jgi:hypothetical protein
MQEARLVNRWAGAEDTRHPHLHHLALWCLSKKDSGHLSLWDLRGGKWTQTQALDGCMEDAEDMETMFS